MPAPDAERVLPSLVPQRRRLVPQQGSVERGPLLGDGPGAGHAHSQRRGWIVQRTGVGIRTASPSMPTGISGASASMTTSWAVSRRIPLAWLPASRAAAFAALSTVTATTPSSPLSRRARRPSPAMSPNSYGLLLTRTACGPSIATSPSTRTTSRGSALPGQDVGQQLQRGAALVVAVGLALHDVGVGAEGGVVDERPAADRAEVDAQLDTVGQRVEAGVGMLPVQPEVHREVVAGARGDDEERQPMLRGDAGDQSLGAVATRDAQQVGAVGSRGARQLGDVHVTWTLEQGHLSAEGRGLRG